MDVIAHQAVSIEAEPVLPFFAPKGIDKLDPVLIAQKKLPFFVAPHHDVIDSCPADSTALPRHRPTPQFMVRVMYHILIELSTEK